MPSLTSEPHEAFEPEAVQVISSVFEKICAELGLSPRGDKLTEIVARQVIEAAKLGMRDETAIRLSVLEQFKSDPQ